MWLRELDGRRGRQANCNATHAMPWTVSYCTMHGCPCGSPRKTMVTMHGLWGVLRMHRFAFEVSLMSLWYCCASFPDNAQPCGVSHLQSAHFGLIIWRCIQQCTGVWMTCPLRSKLPCPVLLMLLGWLLLLPDDSMPRLRLPALLLLPMKRARLSRRAAKHRCGGILRRDTCLVVSKQHPVTMWDAACSCICKSRVVSDASLCKGLDTAVR